MNNPKIVLYQGDTHMILYDRNPAADDALPFKILDKRFVNDWQFEDGLFDIYRKPGELFKMIYNSIAPKGKSK